MIDTRVPLILLIVLFILDLCFFLNYAGCYGFIMKLRLESAYLQPPPLRIRQDMIVHGYVVEVFVQWAHWTLRRDAMTANEQSTLKMRNEGVCYTTNSRKLI